MKADTYTELLKVLQKLEKRIAADAKKRGKAQAERLEPLHEAAETGGTFTSYLEVVAGRTAVHFLLRCVFVRVLEDLGLIPPTIRGQGRFRAFQEVAPSLGHRSYFEWVFRDLAVDFPDLFGERPDDLGPPGEELCREVWELWHAKDKQHNLRYDWRPGRGETAEDDGFDSRFLGDLYQDLDQDVRKKYALLQTPEFVESYILDQTLTPALEVFEPQRLQAEGETFRVIDPTCGSGHFLVGAFHRLADYWEARGLSRWDAAESALESVWGCDINPHAVYIAQFRLVLEVMKRSGVRDLDRLAGLTMNLRTLDSLVPWERREDEEFAGHTRLEQYGTPEERAANALFLDRNFHVIVGNPPYITPKDTQKRDDYRVFWPNSAAGSYGLAAPFVERLFDLGCPGGWMGQITGNAFIKRTFGVSLIEKVLPKWDLTDIVDTSGAYIPGHGTPTVILVGQCQPPLRETIRVLGGKRGEPSAPEPPAEGKVWRAIVEAPHEPIDRDPFITVSHYSRARFSQHPWNVNGGGAPELQERIAGTVLGNRIWQSGYTTVCGMDPVYIIDAPQTAPRSAAGSIRALVTGERVRDFAIQPGAVCLFPYDQHFQPTADDALIRHLWPYRTPLRQRIMFGRRPEDRGDPWYVHMQMTKQKLRLPKTIAFAFVATHNHFVLDRGGKVFNRTAPVIKLPAEATLEDHLDLLGLLNSSALSFWMKQVFFDKGNGGIGGGIAAEAWERFYEYDSTKLKRAPITSNDREGRVALASALDAAAQARAACLPGAVLAGDEWAAEDLPERLTEARSRYQALTERMVALQEELDWLTYRSYGLLDDVEVVLPGDEDPLDLSNGPEPLTPGHRPFEVVLARHNVDCEKDERSSWFTRHGHDEVTTVPSRYSDGTRARLQARLDAIERHKEIALIEQPQFKRRWQLANLDDETRDAARAWLLDRLEDLFAEAGPLAEPYPYALEEIVNAWRQDPRVAAVAAVYHGSPNFDLSTLAELLLTTEGLPDTPLRIYTDSGLTKWRRWQETWRLQDREDAGETVKIPLPPKFAAADFQQADHFKIRGKLNVPRERFIVFADLNPRRYGWNGWRDEQRAIAQVHAFQYAEDDPVNPLPRPTTADPRRCGATIGLWESLPDVRRWGSKDVYEELAALPAESCGQSACPCDVAAAWQQWNAGKLRIEGVDAPDPNAATVGERAALITLLEKHQPVAQLRTDGVESTAGGMSSKDLKQAWKTEGHAPNRFKRVLDELIASGHIANLGRGKNGGLRTAR